MAGLFGSRPRGWTPPINPQLGVDIARENGILPGDQRGLPQMPQAPAKKPGLFGQGGVGRYMAGAIGDALLQNAGMQPIHAPAVQQAQQMAAALRQQSLKREQDWQDWVQRETWKRANPEPQAPNEFQRTLAMAGIDPNSAEGQQLARQRAESMARDPDDAFVVVPIPGRGTYAGPRSGLSDVFGAPRQRNLGPVVNEIPGGGAGNGAGNFPVR